MKARKLTPDSYLSIGSFPVISSPSMRHENVPEVCRIHSSILRRIMTVPRLHLPGLTLVQHRIPIRFSFRQSMIGRFGQMSGHRSNLLGMPLASSNPLIKATDMPRRINRSLQADRMSGFDISPFQVTIDVRPDPPIADFISTRMDSRR